ncbi:caspase family protein [Micromonospora chalcea]
MRRALLIGTDSYEDPELTPLSAPMADVERLAALLRDPEIGHFDSVEVLLNRPSHELLAAVEGFSRRCGPDDLMLIYVSCHGVVDQRQGGSYGLHFAAPNTQSDLLASTSLPARYVNEQINLALARSRVLLLDCCFSGRFADGFSTKSQSSPLQDFMGGGYVVITASDALGAAFEESRDRRSAFTDVLVEGLSSGAADRDDDGFVSTSDLFDYAVPRVRARQAQTPQYMAAGVDGKILLARASRSTSRNGSARPARAGWQDATPAYASPTTTIREWPQAVAAIAAGLDVAIADGDLRLWPTELFGGVPGAAAGLLPWCPEVLPAVIAGAVANARETLASAPRRPSQPGLPDGWAALLQGWWEDAQTHFAMMVRERPMQVSGWWGTGLCHAATGAHRRAAEAFTKAARYASVTDGDVGTATATQMRYIPETSRSIRAGAVLLAMASYALAGDEPHRDLLSPDLAVLSTELRILDACRAGDPVRLAEALTADPAAAAVAVASRSAGQWSATLTEAAPAARQALGRRARDVAASWTAFRDYARRAGLRVPALAVNTPKDSSNLAAAVASHALTVTRAEHLAAAHGRFIATTLTSSGEDNSAAGEAVATIVRIEDQLLPPVVRATLVPMPFLYSFSVVRDGNGVIGYVVPAWGPRERLSDGSGYEEQRRNYFKRPVMSRTTLAAWLTGAIPAEHDERLGTITTDELALLLFEADVLIPRLYVVKNGRRQRSLLGRERTVDAGWKFDHVSETSSDDRSTSCSRYLMPDGQIRVETVTTYRAHSKSEESFSAGPCRLNAEQLRTLRQSIVALASPLPEWCPPPRRPSLDGQL